MSSAAEVVAQSVAAYNVRDLEAFVIGFDPDVEMFEMPAGERTAHGLAAVRERYRALFQASPALHAQILHRAVLGDVVTDHELVTGRAGGDLEFSITYQVVTGRIRRVWTTRAPAGEGVGARWTTRAPSGEGPLRIALAQVPYPETPEASIAHVVRVIGEASRAGAAIVAFPECYVPGYRGPGHALPPPDAAFLERAWTEISTAAAASHVAVVLGTERIVEGELRATALVIDETGCRVGFQDKVQVDPALVIDEGGRRVGFQDKVQVDPSEEGTYAAALGGERRVFAVAGTTIGVVICHEGWRYPETVRFAARRGAPIVFHLQYSSPDPGGASPARFGAGSFHDQAILGRAAENTCFFASVNYALDRAPIATAIAAPDGSLLAVQPYGEPGMLVADLELAAATCLLATRCRS